MKSLLVMCPSRGRPKRLEEMMESFSRTKSPETVIEIYISKDDPKYVEYFPLYQGTIVEINRKYLAEAYNYIYELNPGFDYYCPINDDHYFLTPEWDKKLIDIVETQGNGWGMACAEDLLTNWSKFQHPSGCVISGNIPRTLGYFIPPGIQHIGIDVFFMRLLKGIDRLYHTTDVVIEHRHWLNGKAFLDDNYRFVYSRDQYDYGMQKISEYIKNQLENDVAKLKEAMKWEKESGGQ